jgi:hypothetical protein
LHSEQGYHGSRQPRLAGPRVPPSAALHR